MTSKTFIKRLNTSITVEGQNLINEFFVTFSRFECALKAAGFASGDNNKVNPNWDTFTASIQESFDNEARNEILNTAIDYLQTIHQEFRIMKMDNWDGVKDNFNRMNL